jgi:hypothetical protein
LFDIYNPEEGKFISPESYHLAARESGFHTVPWLSTRKEKGYEPSELENFSLNMSRLGTEVEAEGIYVKVVDASGYVTKRFKMVRPGYVPGVNFNPKGELVRNRRAK